MNKTIVIVAGEASGDALGAGLMKAMLTKDPSLEFEGIGGPNMLALGFNSLVPMERLSVMGLVEVLGRLFELLRIRSRLIKKYTQTQPSVMIGIDSPDFNLSLETKLKNVGVPTLHYVSPSVWAWRQERVFKVAKACHRVLSILPFELPYYQQHNIPATYVGHRLADELPGNWSKSKACAQLHLDEQQPILALLPGSRQMEVKQLGHDFLQAALALQNTHPQLQVLVASASPACEQQLQQLLEILGASDQISIVSQQTFAVLAAADAVLVASGTATLEAMLFAKPMLVCYRLSKLSYWMVKDKLTTKYISLPNILADQGIVDELQQEQVEASSITTKLESLLFDEATRNKQQSAFLALHDQLACGADQRAAAAVFDVMAQNSNGTNDDG